ncbi:cyclin-T2 isoform X1 [Ornithorhynchus anatinus]|uniref:Cyclin T2 n=1 Tax=Ornithorhynchus anatinus TaxID=9258 RepID=A0A6I8N9C9_ORNAN|nr:cyclin-T2 isoform X1 [Ornithorhynchus anatinus]
MASGRGASSRWFFSREQLENTPSRRCEVEADKELSYRQQAANLIQDMGQRLNVSQLTINTAIVYMHRFYMHHSFTKFNRNGEGGGLKVNIISPTALFLAAKVEEQPRKLEHVIKVAHACLQHQELDTKSDAYLQQAQELVILETIMLQTLGFEITIEHPHTDVVKCTQLVRASKDLAQTSYFMATNSLHLTTFCLQYRPTVIACVCIHLACKWSNWEIPVSTDGKHWWEYVDPSVTLELLDELTHEFLQILEKTPSRLKRIRNWRAIQAAKRPKGDGQGPDTSLLGSSLVQNSILVDGVAGVPANASFPKPSTSAFPAPVPLSAGSLSVSDSHPTDSLAMLAGGLLPGPSYGLASHQEWPPQQQQQDAARTEPAYAQKQEATLSAGQYNLSVPPPAAGQPHPGLHHRSDKAPEHAAAKPEFAPKSGGGKHHGGPLPAAPTAIPQKMSLDKYREKRKLETLELDGREHYMAAPLDQPQHKRHVPPQVAGSGPVASPIKMKLPAANAEKPERYSSSSSSSSSSDKREKSGSLKLRIPIPPTEKGVSKEELKMKIKVSSSERHSSSDEGSAKGKDPKEKHREHSSGRLHGGGGPHKHSHVHGGGGKHGGGGGPHGADGMPPAVLRSPAGLSGDGSSSGSSSGSTRRKLHVHEAAHNHHSKMSKSSKSSGSSSSSSSSVKQYVSSHKSVFNLPLPPPPPVTYQVGYGHLSTLVKLDRKPVETNGPDAPHEYSANSQHMDYKDTFDMLDSLLSAQGMTL